LQTALQILGEFFVSYAPSQEKSASAACGGTLRGTSLVYS